MIKLRDYQQETIDAIFADWKLADSTMVVAATGAGKTEMMLGTMDRILIDEPSARILLIAHRKELIHQPIERIERNWPSLAGKTGIVMADQNDTGAQIIVATVQTLGAKGRIDGILQHGPINYVFTDECHHATADSYRSVYGALGRFKHVGVTATPIRADGDALGAVFGRLAARLTIDKLIRRGFLCPPRWLAIQTGVSLAGVPKNGSGTDRDYSAKGLRSIFEVPKTWRWVVESHQKYAQDRKAIAFLATVDGAYELAEAFNVAGISAAAADATTHKTDRAALLDEFRTGNLQVLCNVALWTEGLDLPEISCVHMVRPTQSDAYYLQAVGRGLRTFAGKEDALILDYAPVEYRNVKMLGDVLGIEASKDAYMDDAEPGDAQAGFTYDGEVKWMTDNPMEIISRQLDYLSQSPWRWVQNGKNDWLVLGLGRGNDEIERTLVMSPPSKTMQLYGVWKRPAQRWPQAELISTGSFEELSECGEDIANKHGQAILMQKSVGWRKQSPSDGQLRFAEKLGIMTAGMTKGDVANAITRQLALQAVKRSGVNI